MPSTIWICLVEGLVPGDQRIRAWTPDADRAEAFRKEGLEMQEFSAVAQAAPDCGGLEAALAGSNMFSRASERSHSIVIEFETLEAMQKARDVIIKASVPAVRAFAQSSRAADCSKAIEACAKIAEPWAGFWLDEKSTDADRAVVEVRKEIAAKIRAMAVPSASLGSAAK